MRAALIPPVPHLNEYGHGSFHLLLAHLVKRGAYRAHYQRERHLNSYLVLDNSAHEMGAGESAEQLTEYMIQLNTQEVVVPDVLDDADATIEACLRAHEVWYERRSKLMQKYDPALMYVPQGETEEDWVRCLRELVRIHSYTSRKFNIRSDFVLGISKDYEKWEGGIENFIDSYVLPMQHKHLPISVKMPVHLLGWGRDLWTLNYLAQKYPWIRSTDSAKPFVYALADIRLQYGKTPEYPTRPERYFGKKLTYNQQKMATHNVLLFLKAAAGELR